MFELEFFNQKNELQTVDHIVEEPVTTEAPVDPTEVFPLLSKSAFSDIHVMLKLIIATKPFRGFTLRCQISFKSRL